MDIDLDLFIPPDFGDKHTHVYGTFVDLMQQVINGTILDSETGDPVFNFPKELENFTAYWDVFRSDDADVLRLREVLEPVGYTDVLQVIGKDTLRSFLSTIGNIYSIKGTFRSFDLLLQYINMKINVIPWYSPDYQNYFPDSNEQCRVVLRVKIGNNPLTDATEELYKKYISLLVDACTIISAWVFVKDLYDTVEIEELYNDGIRHEYPDLFDRCEFVLQEKYGLCYEGVEKNHFDDCYVTKYLDPDESVTYICSNCNVFEYDPIVGHKETNLEKRTSYAQIPSLWQCPVCSFPKNYLVPTMFNPTYGVATNTFLALIAKNWNYVLTLQSIFINNGVDFVGYPEVYAVLEKADALVTAIGGSIGVLDNIDDYAYVLMKVFADNYRFLKFSGLNVNPQVIERYTRGYMYSPYFCYAAPDTDEPIWRYQGEEENQCGTSIIYDGTVAYPDPTKMIEYNECRTLYIDENMVRYGTDETDSPPYDGTFAYGMEFDLPYNPKEVWSQNTNFNFYAHGQNGIYAPPRYGLPAQLGECDFIFGLVDGVMDVALRESLVRIYYTYDFATEIGEWSDLLTTTDTAVTIYKDFIGSLRDLTLIFDSAYQTTFYTYAGTVLTPLEVSDLTDALTFFNELQLTDIMSLEMVGALKSVAPYALAASQIKEFIWVKDEWMLGSVYDFLYNRSNLALGAQYWTLLKDGIDKAVLTIQNETCKPYDPEEDWISMEYFRESILEAPVDGWSDIEIWKYDGAEYSQGVVCYDGTYKYSDPRFPFWLHDNLTTAISEDGGLTFIDEDPLLLMYEIPAEDVDLECPTGYETLDEYLQSLVVV